MPDDANLLRAAKLDATSLSDALDRFGIAGQCLGIKPLDHRFRMTGRAFTILYGPAGSPPGSVGDYIDEVPPGSVVVLDNGVWGTGDGLEPTATAFGVDLIRLALAAGWDERHVYSPVDASDLWRLLSGALDRGGPHLIVAKTDATKDEPSSAARPRPKRHVLDCAVLMRAELSGDG